MKPARTILIGLFFVLVWAQSSLGQTNIPQVEWQTSLGGPSEEYLYSVQPTSDGGFIVGGYSPSPPGGNKTSPNFGGADYWVVRLDRQGQKIWDRSFGGADEDVLTSLQQTSDGGFILGGYAWSGTTGNKTSTNYGAYDFWVVRLNANGDAMWQSSFGGGSDDRLYSLQQTSDGGFILGGISASPRSGNKTSEAFGDYDFWVVRLDEKGNKLWDRTYGGSGRDILRCLRQTSDGGFILGGESASTDGNKTASNFGGPDFWVVRTDANGSMLWDKTYGGNAGDGLNTLRETSDGGFVLGGYSSSSSSGNKTSDSWGDEDCWVVRTDAAGNILWDRSFGGDSQDELTGIYESAGGGFICGATSRSGATGNKLSSSFGVHDAWLFYVTADGTKTAEASFGGSLNEYLYSLEPTGDGGCVFGAYSDSGADGNKTSPNYGGGDFWVVKLTPPRPRLSAPLQTFGQIQTNGFQFFLTGPSGTSCRLEYSHDLRTWTPFRTNQIGTGAVQIVDTSAKPATLRFYRARQLP